jgi:hypothetical protein
MSRVSNLLLIVVISLAAGCKSSPQAKAVRVALSPDSPQWSLRLNRDGIVSGQAHKFSNQLMRLQLKQGDVMLLARWNDPIQPSVSGLIEWLSRYCATNGVALYVHPEMKISGGIFSVPVFHWMTPFSNPRNMYNSRFFLEGKLLGTGMFGFKRMLRLIEENKPRHIFILGSLYDWNSGFGTIETPYERQEYLLNETLKKIGTELLLPSQLPGHWW